MLETLGEPVTVRDLAGALVYANAAALRQLGLASVDDLAAMPSADIMGEYVVTDEHGRPLTVGDLPSVRLLQGEPVQPLLVHTIHRTTGASAWQLLRSEVLRSADGAVVAALTVIEDLSAVKNAESRMRILSESGRIFASTRDPRETLDHVAQLPVPELADWCIVDLVSEDLRRVAVAVAHRDTGNRHLLKRLRELETEAIDPNSLVGRVLVSGEAELLTEITEEHRFRGAVGAEHLSVLRGLKARSALAVPLRVGERVLGVMTCATADSLRRLSAEDLDLAAQLAGRAAMALENTRLHATLTSVAETLQLNLRPSELPAVAGWDIAGLYRPAGSLPRIDVGGDFYEVVAAPHRRLVLIGDVTGHGVTAATVTALLRHGLRFAARDHGGPAAILSRLDEALRQRSELPLCTALCASLGTGAMTVSSAGHPPAMIVSPDATIRELPVPGPLLGAFTDAAWTQETVPVASGDLVLLYTDGVTEMVGGHDRFGSDRLAGLLAQHAGASPQALLDALERTLASFGEGEPRDDVAALALRPVG